MEQLLLFPTVLIAALLSALASGLIAPYVVVKRLHMLSGTLAHALIGGVGFALWLSYTLALSALSPTLITLGSALLAALLISYIYLYHRESQAAALTLLWSGGMSLGLLLAAKTPGNNLELNDYLFGNLIWLSSEQLWLLIGVNLSIITSLMLFYRQILLVCLDEEEAQIRALRYPLIYTLLITLIALVVVVLMETTGLLLAMTLLTTPAMVAQRFCTTFASLHLMSLLVALAMSLGGLVLAAILDLPIGPTTALVGSTLFMLSLLGKK